MIRSKVSLARRAAFVVLLAEYSRSAEMYDAGEEEDPRPFVSGRRACSRFVCITRNLSQADGKEFFLPIYDSVRAAAGRATVFVEDDIFEEVPVEVRDLDTGEGWFPDWDTLRFTGKADPFRGDAGAVLIAETLADRGFANVEAAMGEYMDGDEGGDFRDDFVGPMIDRAAVALFGTADPEGGDR